MFMQQDDSQASPAEDADGFTGDIVKQEKLNLPKQPKHLYSKISLASIQTASSFLLEWTPNIITIYFLARTGNDLWVASFGLGLLWANCLGFGVLTGLACGLETLVSQAFGACQFKLCGKYYNYSLATTVMMMIPIILCQFFSDTVLSLINSDEALVSNAVIFTRSIIPAIFLNGVYQMTKCFLTGHNIYNLQVVAQLTSTALHIPWCIFFIQYQGMGMLGCALARGCTELTSIIALYLLIQIMKPQLTFAKFRVHHFFKAWKFVQQAVPIGSLLWLEWMSYECYSLQASFLTAEALAANVIMNNFTTLYFQFPYGISIAASTYVGSAMGNGDSKLAKRLSRFSCLFTGLILLITQIILYVFKQTFLSTFSESESVQSELSNSFLFMQGLLVFDGFQAVLTGISRGIGHEKFSLASFFFFYLFVGQVSSYFLCFKLSYNLNGVWLGMMIGAAAYDLLQIIILLCSNWNKQCHTIISKIERNNQNTLMDIKPGDLL